MLEGPDEEGGHQPAVLSGALHRRIGCPRQHRAPRDARHLLVVAGPAEQVVLDLGLPGAEARAGPGAQGATLEAVGAVVRPAVGVDVERLVDPVLVVVAEDVIGADDDTGGAPRAQPGGHDLGEQLGPLRLLGRHWSTIFGLGAPVGYLAPVPEILEVELYRVSAEAALHRPIARAWMVDSRYGRGGTTPARLRSALVGRSFSAARRIGKLLLLDTDGGPTLGLRFGMTGRPCGRRQRGARPAALRARCLQREVGAGPLHLRRRWRALMHDPRRFGSLELAPDESRLGPDALTAPPEGAPLRSWFRSSPILPMRFRFRPVSPRHCRPRSWTIAARP